MADVTEIFQKARQDSAKRISDNIQTFITGTPSGQKPDHNGALNAAVIAELTQLAAGQAVLESQLNAVRADMLATGAIIAKVVEFIQKPVAPPVAPE